MKMLIFTMVFYHFNQTFEQEEKCRNVQEYKDLQEWTIEK
jgi:hypothetical protein